MREAGMMTSPGVPLLTIEDDDAYRLEAEVPDSMIRTIQKGDAVRIELESETRTEIQGRISEIVPSADSSTRSTIVKIGLASNPSLRSGMFGRSVFAHGARSVIAVPRALIVQHGQLTSVYVLDIAACTRNLPGWLYPDYSLQL